VANYGTLTITHTIISGNTAIDGNGGGVLNATGGLLTITNSTISDNRGFYYGGGMANRGTLTITNSTIAGNTVTCRDIPGSTTPPMCLGISAT
jgi:hypothetical protein